MKKVILSISLYQMPIVFDFNLIYNHQYKRKTNMV
jgi:hypothetical protein